MSNATRVIVGTFGTLAGLAGIEHGIGEILQGNQPPDGIVIMSWPESAFFQIVAGEPAMTIVPNLLITGILASLVSLIFLIWVTMFVQRKHGALVLILLSIILLLVGGGFGPPLLGIILGVVATRIDAPLTWWHTHLARGAQHFLSAMWSWSFVAALIAWLFMFPGASLLDYFVGVSNPEQTMATLILSAFGLLLMTIMTGFAHDLQRQTDVQLRPTMIGN
jgi:hypothetical protein